MSWQRKGRNKKKTVKENPKDWCTCVCVLSQGCCFRGPRFAELLGLSGGWDVDGAGTAGGPSKMGLRHGMDVCLTVPNRPEGLWWLTLLTAVEWDTRATGRKWHWEQWQRVLWGVLGHAGGQHSTSALLTFWQSTVGFCCPQSWGSAPIPCQCGAFLWLVPLQEGAEVLRGCGQPEWVSWPGPGVLLHVLGTDACSASPLRAVLCPHHPCACSKWQRCRSLFLGEDPKGFLQ